MIVLHYRKMGFINATSYILQRLVKSKKLIVAKLKNCTLKILLRNDRDDTQVFTQIFLREELNIDLKTEPAVIIDCGANIGMATLYLKNKYPDAFIISVEPEERNFNILKQNTNQLGNVICLRNGIWNKTCKLEIIDNGNGNASFITKEVETEMENDGSIINAITISEIISTFNIKTIDLLKLDIEGSEKEVFENNYEDWLLKTNNIIVEIHPNLNHSSEEIIFSRLKEKYSKMQVGEYMFFESLQQ